MGNKPSSPGLTELLKKENGLLPSELIIVGGRINTYDEHGLTPLHRAILANSLTEVERLIELGADPEVKTESGWSSFHIAAKTGNMEIMAILLGKNVAVDEVSKAKEELENKDKQKIVFVGRSTALHVAAQMGHSKVAHLLASLGQGAEKVKNDEGLTPTEVAEQHNQREVVKVLQSDMAALRREFDEHKREVDQRFRSLEKRLSIVEGKRNVGGRNTDSQLTDNEKSQIKKNFFKLSKMNVKQLICLMYSRCLLSCEDMESLRSLQGAEDLQKKFIINNKLVGGSVKDIKMVKDVFKDSGHGSLVDCLPTV